MILYELIAGDVPFRGTTPMQVLIGRIQTPPPQLRSHRPDVPPAVEAVVQRALAKDPAARFERAGDLAQALITAWCPTPTVTLADQPDISSASDPPVAPTCAQAIAGTIRRAGVCSSPNRFLVQQVAAAQQHSGGLLPLPAGMLVLLLLGGMFLAWRGERSTPAVPTRTAVAAPAASASRATAAPTIPSPATLLPADATDSIAGLRMLLTAGAADGRAGTAGKDLLTQLERAQQAVMAGNAPEATEHLFAMQKTVLQGVRAGTLERAFAQQVLSSIETIATSNHLTLPLSVKLEGSDQ